jgi:hypothetical protein
MFVLGGSGQEKDTIYLLLLKFNLHGSMSYPDYTLFFPDWAPILAQGVAGGKDEVKISLFADEEMESEDGVEDGTTGCEVGNFILTQKFTHSFDKYLWPLCYVSGDFVRRKADKNFHLLRTYRKVLSVVNKNECQPSMKLGCLWYPSYGPYGI